MTLSKDTLIIIEDLLQWSDSCLFTQTDGKLKAVIKYLGKEFTLGDIGPDLTLTTPLHYFQWKLAMLRDMSADTMRRLNEINQMGIPLSKKTKELLEEDQFKDIKARIRQQDLDREFYTKFFESIKNDPNFEDKVYNAPQEPVGTIVSIDNEKFKTEVFNLDNNNLTDIVNKLVTDLINNPMAGQGELI